MAFKNDVFFSAELRNGDYHENDSLSGLAQDLINSYSEEPCLYNMELTRYKIADHSMKVITGKYWDIFCDVVEEAFENQVETPYQEVLMSIETQKELERVMLINMLSDIINEETITPNRAMKATKLIEHVNITDLTEYKIIRQNKLAGYGKERVN